MSTPIAVILLAGLGSRLGRPHPKSLTPISERETILGRQLSILGSFNIPVIGVVGFKKDIIMEAAPDIMFVYNPEFDTTNTSKSLLCALNQIENRDVLWLNGDVVFDRPVLESMLSVSPQDSLVAVNTEKVAEEEVKYITNDAGKITQISKQVKPAEGEALGINLIRAEHLAAFKTELAAVDEQDYFEKAMENMILAGNQAFVPVDVSKHLCVEVDFEEDLASAKAQLQNHQ